MGPECNLGPSQIFNHDITLLVLWNMQSDPVTACFERLSAFEAVDSGSIPRLVKTFTVNVDFTAFLLDVKHCKGTV